MDEYVLQNGDKKTSSDVQYLKGPLPFFKWKKNVLQQKQTFVKKTFAHCASDYNVLSIDHVLEGELLFTLMQKCCTLQVMK